MKKQIQELIAQSLKSLASKELIPAVEQAKITIENSRDSAHGDFASNIAMILAKTAKDIFKGKQLVTGAVWFRNASIKTISATGKWYQQNVTFEFIYDETE